MKAGSAKISVWTENHNTKVSKSIFGIIFLALFVFPDAFSILLHASSMRVGLTVGMLIFSTILMLIAGHRNIGIKKKYLIILTLFFLLVFIQYLVSHIIFNGVDNYRFILSYLLAGLIFIASALFVNVVRMVKDASLNYILLFSYYLLIIIGFISLFLIPHGLVHGKSMVIFTEPSHYALIYLPMLLYVSYSSKSFIRIAHLLVGVILAIFLQSMTLLAGAVLIMLLLYIKKSYKLLFLITLAVFVFWFLPINYLDYFFNRLPLSSNSSNLSVLVYLSGYQRAYLSILDSYGFGLGFQQLGIVGPTGSVMKNIDTITGGSTLNLLGGGSLAAKLIAELGITGIVLLVVYLLFVLNISMRFIRGKINGVANIFFSSVFITFFVFLFIRGTGYFSSTVFMFTASIYWLYSSKNSLKHKIKILKE